MALSGLSRARHDGLYRTLGTLTTSSMAGRDCLPATHSDSATHARRAHAYREQQNTPFMRLRHASGSTLQHPISSSRHANKACICSAHAPWLLRTPQTMHAPSFPRPLPLPDARSAVSARTAQTRHCHWHAMRAGGAPSTASPAQAPICPASERRKRDPGPSRALSGSNLLPWPKSAQNRANAQQWSRGRVRGLIYWLVQPSVPHCLRILGSTGCSRCWVCVEMLTAGEPRKSWK